MKRLIHFSVLVQELCRRTWCSAVRSSFKDHMIQNNMTRKIRCVNQTQTFLQPPAHSLPSSQTISIIQMTGAQR